MNKWANWVDLVIVIIVFRTCYSGFVRGFFSELLTVAGLVSVTALCINYAGFVTAWLRPWIGWADPTITSFLVFWGLFFGSLFLVHLLIKFLTTFIKWEKMHWFLQGIGITLGGLRGLWWSGVVVIAFVSSGFTYLRTSVEERSLVGPRLLSISREWFERVADGFPGAEYRGKPILPPLKAGNE